jgi:hypothetical protein
VRTRAAHLLAAALGAALALAPAARAGDVAAEFDPAGDAVVRRTDSCNCGPLGPGAVLPDLLSATATPWQSSTAMTDPYTGSQGPRTSSHLVKIELRFAGLINPPGTLGLNGQAYNPFQFGPSPLYGSLEIDVDRDDTTGGETPDVAALRYLGNAARFGGLPHRLAARAARSAADLNQPWTSTPQLCLTGADWVLVFCGCTPLTVVSRSDPSHATFQAGDTWIVSGRLFQRTSAYKAASLMTGGSGPGAYDPIVKVRFQHSAQTNQTTVTLVYALTQVGAAQLTTQPQQAINLRADDQTSIAEGVTDLIAAAQSRPLTGLAAQVTAGWNGRRVSDATEPGRWRMTALFGTAYAQPTDGLYVWTDIGFDCAEHDVDGDGAVTPADRQAVAAFIAARDGGPDDADGAADGRLTIPAFGTNFSVYDVDADGVVGPADLAAFSGGTPCPADHDHSGALDILDIFAFLQDWFALAPAADFDHEHGVDILDIFAFLTAWFAGC